MKRTKSGGYVSFPFTVPHNFFMTFIGKALFIFVCGCWILFLFRFDFYLVSFA